VRARFEPTRRIPSSLWTAIWGCAVPWLLAACEPPEQPQVAEVRPVRTITIEEQESGETISLTGQISAQEEVNLAFRVTGRMIERNANVGDRVTPGQVVARLESVTARNAMAAARADLAGFEAGLADARLEFDRQRRLFEQRVAARAVFERATKARDAAQARVAAARAQLDTAREQLTFTDLVADAAGSVTARGAEPGEVVAAGQMVLRVARKGGRDAVFDVPARVIEAARGLDPEVTVTLTSNATVQTVGRAREISPQADPVTRTFEVKVGLTDLPDAMRLGSTVTGTIRLGSGTAITVPASALTSANGSPAVWIVDPNDNTVSLQNIEVESFGVAEVTVAEGLAPDDIVVIAGAQALRPGQKVRLSARAM
jgi:RND family efflux transporter MFP subunit